MSSPTFEVVFRQREHVAYISSNNNGGRGHASGGKTGFPSCINHRKALLYASPSLRSDGESEGLSA